MDSSNEKKSKSNNETPPQETMEEIELLETMVAEQERNLERTTRAQEEMISRVKDENLMTELEAKLKAA